MKVVSTFTAQIAVGFKNTDTEEELSVRIAREICQDYCNKEVKFESNRTNI